MAHVMPKPLVKQERDLSEDLFEICPSCGGTMREGKYVCRDCHRQPCAPMVLVADKPEFIPKKYNKTATTDTICGNCEKLIPCRERVMNRNGGPMWCYCEIPCEDDLLIMANRDFRTQESE